MQAHVNIATVMSHNFENIDKLSIEELLSKAHSFYNKNRFVESEIYAIKTLELDKNSHRAIDIIFSISIETKNYNSAIHLFRENPNAIYNSKSLVKKASQLFMLKHDVDSAIMVLLEAQKIHKTDTQLRELLSEIAIRNSKFDIFPCKEFTKPTNPQSTQSKDLSFNLIITVWGTEYTSFFTNTTIPTQLGKDNISSLSTESRSTYLIYTTPKDAKEIVKSNYFEQLCQDIDVKIYCVKNLGKTLDKYQTMTAVHKHALKKSIDERSHALFWSPDAIASRSTFRTIYQKASQGYKALMYTAMLTIKSKVTSYIATILSQETEAPLDVETMKNITFDFLHPMTNLSTTSGSDFTPSPSIVAWKVKDEGFILHCFHLHPIMLYPDEYKDFKGPIDVDATQKLCKNFDDIHIIQDLDEMYVFSVEDDQRTRQGPASTYSEDFVAAWADENAIEYHRRQFEYGLQFHTKPGTKDKAEWDKMTSIATKASNSILSKTSLLRCKRINSNLPKQITERSLRHSPKVIECISYKYLNPSPVSHHEQLLNIAESQLTKKIELNLHSVLQLDSNQAQDLLQVNEGKTIFHGNISLLKQRNSINNLLLSKFETLKIIEENPDTAWKRNLSEIRKIAIQQGWRQPEIELTYYLTKENSLNLKSIVQRTFENRIWKIKIIDPGMAGTPSKDSIFFQTVTEAKKIVSGIYKGIEAANSLGIDIIFVPKEIFTYMLTDKLIYDYIFENLDIKLGAAASPPHCTTINNKYSFMKAVQEGNTRECLKPWHTLRINFTGESSACELRPQPIGNLDNTEMVDLIRNNNYTDLRNKLLIGDLHNSPCEYCPLAPEVPIQKLKYKVANLLRKNR